MQGDEAFTLGFHAEQSDGFVEQSNATLRRVEDGRQASVTLTLTGQPDEDRALASSALESLRSALPHLPRDPHLLVNESDAETHEKGPSGVAPAAEIVDAFLDAVEGLDAVGILARGPVARGFASRGGSGPG